MSKISRNPADFNIVHLPRCQNKSGIVTKQDDDELNLSPRRTKVAPRHPSNNERVKWNTVPSPASGISEECLAMANACNHDHDYIVMPLSKSKEYENENDKDGGIITLNSVSSESMPIIKAEFMGKTGFIPKPPPNASLEKAARRQSLRRSTKNAPRITKLFFTSDSKTAYRPQKQKQLEQTTNIDTKTEANENVTKTPHPPKNCSNNNNNQMIMSEPESDEDISFLSTKHSSPIGNNTILSPRLSITPMPPSDQRRRAGSVRSRRHIQRHCAEDSDGDGGSEVGNSNDSAYSSLSCSASSHPRTPSGGRPQSGDKRSATSNLSSSSSFSSTDEESDGDLKVSNSPQMMKPHDEVKVEQSDNELDQEIKPHIPKIITKKSHKKIVKLETIDKNEIAPIDHQKFMPTPPTRKHKKGVRSHDPLPMRLRALPTSFWQEPNKMSAVTYGVLPPVQLFRQSELMDDVTDIRPITPPEEPESHPKILPLSTKPNVLAPRKTVPKVVIKTGDTDLLLRLFDKVESKNSTKKSNPHRPKRGRPRRATRCAIPPPRLPFNEDPCIIDSITEKLFPKLSLEHRKRSTSRLNEATDDQNNELYPIATTSGSNIPDEFDFQLNDNFEDCFTANFLDANEGFESLSTPNVSNQRSISVSFPQLSNTGPDLSQILSELAAGL